MKTTLVKRVIRRISIAISAVMLVFLSACFDLGAFEDVDSDSDYYDSFGAVKGLFESGNRSYDVKDSLFNDFTVENLDWENDEDRVDSEEYVYIVLEFKKAIKIESLALFLSANSDATIEIESFYYADETFAPKKIKYKSSPDTETVTVSDESGNEVTKEVEIVYDDLLSEQSVADATCDVINGEWSSFMLAEFKQAGYDDGLLHTGIGGLLYIRINDNSGLFPESETCSFKFINLLVRAV